VLPAGTSSRLHGDRWHGVRLWGLSALPGPSFPAVDLVCEAPQIRLLWRAPAALIDDSFPLLSRDFANPSKSDGSFVRACFLALTSRSPGRDSAVGNAASSELPPRPHCFHDALRVRRILTPILTRS